MPLKGWITAALLPVIMGCTSPPDAPPSHGARAFNVGTFVYKDGGTSTFYSFSTGQATSADTVIFFYGGSGCPSWRTVMPEYIDGLSVNAWVFALNKRLAPQHDERTSDCSREFHLANNPRQWVADYAEFINSRLEVFAKRPKHVVLVGVSEGALPATMIAATSSAVTHLALIGSGGYSMRRDLTVLKELGIISLDVASGWREIAHDPESVDKHWYGNPYRWWFDIMDFDPLPDLLSLQIPILVGIGDKDGSVPAESVRFLEERFREAGKENLDVRIYPGADHRLNADGVSYRPDFFAALANRLQARPFNEAPARRLKDTGAASRVGSHHGAVKQP